MSRARKFHNPEGIYFVSFAVIEWIDVFTRNEYRNIVVNSLQYCQKEKGMEIFAWCIMTNHIHLIFRSNKGQKPELLLGDFKRFTSKKINYIHNNPVKEGLVYHPKEYVYSSARDYAGKTGLIEGVVVVY